MAAIFITPPEQNHTRSANADWMELQALRGADRRSTVGDIAGIFDINDDDAPDRAGDDPHGESILEAGRSHLIDDRERRGRRTRRTAGATAARREKLPKREWLGGRDSNPDSTVQSRVSYH